MTPENLSSPDWASAKSRQQIEHDYRRREIVEALKLFEQSPVLRRMYYAALLVALIWVIRWW